jgi:ADP-ribose pyrophosphatase
MSQKGDDPTESELTTFRVTGSRRLFEGHLVNLRVDTIDVGEGRTVEREIVEHPGSIVAVPIDDQDRVLLVRQYRHPAGQQLLELPAGGLEPGEDPEAAARRELREEIGFSPGIIEHLGGFYTAPGFLTEFLHLFIARDLTPDPLEGDWDEDIEIVPTPLGEVRSLIEAGEIIDAKSIAGLLWVLGRSA